ncbi:MAG: TIM barrel protein [Planctomycetota bacterium]|nr:TIM barrel protein [Planctomycetota bacterium]
MNRRTFIQTLPVSVAVVGGALSKSEAASTQEVDTKTTVGGGSAFRHSVCQWCYSSMDLADLTKQAKAMGIESIELLNEEQWKVVQANGLTCAVANGPTTISSGFNRIENHDAIVKRTEELLPKIKAAGIPNMIVFSGNRAGLSDADGLKNCAIGLKRITPLAESLGVTVIMELLNSKIDHKDYQCDHTAWGGELVKRTESDRFRLLYDIYHMQVMEGDVINTISDHQWAIAHYHTGGVPGRAEIDHTQELNYAAICRALKSIGYRGYFAQEFIPQRDPMKSLAEAVRICTV